MYVIVIGPRERNAVQDSTEVFLLLDRLIGKYGSSMVVVSTACDRGVGSFVKQKCLLPNSEFRFLEITQRIYADLPRSRMLQVFLARNAWLAELGDEFHVFTNKDRRASLRDDTIDDLLRRLEAIPGDQNGKRPVYTYEPGSVTSGGETK